MKNLKENNIQKSLWHIKRHCEKIEKNIDDRKRKIELKHVSLYFIQILLFEPGLIRFCFIRFQKSLIPIFYTNKYS